LIAACAGCAALAGCTDAATRVAYDIEAGAKGSQAERSTIAHRPKSWPDGCGGDYTLQLSRESSLVVWCSSEESSYTTNYHLRFVEVPETFKVYKRAGEPVLIVLERHDGRVIVKDLR
jgi:hypothetical protein